MNKKKSPKRIAKTKAIHESSLHKKIGRDYHLFFLWAVIILVSIIRYRLIAVPFERDEGEYGYIGSLLLHGIAPFKGAYTMKLPGTPLMYAILMAVFGHTNTGIHLGMVLINATTMYFLFVAFKKIFNPFIGLSTASIYGLMAIALVFDGFAAHATQFICFYSSIALFFLAGFIKSEKYLTVFLCGLMFGMAFLMKQQAVFLILFGAVFLFIYLKTEKKQNFPEIIKKISWYGAGVCIPYLIIVLIVLFAGQFRVFWLWTVEYASKYEAVKSGALIISYFKGSFSRAWDAYNYSWVLALAGILVLFWSPYNRLQKLFALLYFIASSCVVCSGFYFLPHYYIVVLPAIGLMAGIFIEFISKQIREWINVTRPPNIALGILSIFILITIYINREYFFSYSSDVVCNMAYWGNPFNEAREIARYVKDNSTDTDKIAVVGSEPELYFYANRMSATGYLYTYPLVENQPYNEIMQEQMIGEIEKNKPLYFIFCDMNLSWLRKAETPMTIYKWANTYTQAHYTAVGIDEFFNNSNYSGWYPYWNDNINRRLPNPQGSVIIYRRNRERDKL